VNLKELDSVLNKALAGWRKGLANLDHSELTQLLEDDNVVDEVIELREAIAELVAKNKEAAIESRAGEVNRFGVAHLLRIGVEEVISAHKVVEAMRTGTPMEARTELLVHPDRYYYDGELPPELTTGILVRAKDPDKRFGSYDIGQLTLASLTNWLRSSGQIAPLAENTLAIVLGHDLNAEDNRQGRNGRAPFEYQQEQDRKAREAREQDGDCGQMHHPHDDPEKGPTEPCLRPEGHRGKHKGAWGKEAL
jgi:hypothetical protein